MEGAARPERLRIADLLAALSIVTDMGFGLPPGQAMRSCLIATALGRKLDLPDDDVSAAFYTALLNHVGCISMSHETSVLFGNELTLTRAVAMTNLADPNDYVATLVPEATRDLDDDARDTIATAIITSGPAFGRLYDTASGEVAGATARRLGLSDGTQRALREVAESWDGSGAPRGLHADEIAVAARVVRVAADAAFFDTTGTRELAIAQLKQRSGGMFDPDIVDVFLAAADEFLEEAATGDPRDRILEVEPIPRAEVDRARLAEVATAFADASDLKTPFMHDHSRRVAALATSAARSVGLEAGDVEDLRVAALLHDVGRVGVSDVVWEKAGPLTTADWELVRMHPYHSERILAVSRVLAPIARIAGMHHERLDGSGYYRGCSRNEIPMAARILAAADAFVAMSQERPHRSALDQKSAARELGMEARDGRLDGDAVSAVLQAAGEDRPLRGDRSRPAGLSEREVEVLRLVAAGCSNPDIAERLTISRRTAEHHVQHIYTKIGVATRPGAALFALQHDLLS